MTKKRHSHVPQVFWDRDRDLVEGVSRRWAVGVEGPDAFCRDDLVVCGVACRVFNHIELKTTQDERFFLIMWPEISDTSLTAQCKLKKNPRYIKSRTAKILNQLSN